MRKILAISLILVSLAAGTVCPQETYFGKNKTRYKQFDWSYIQTRHFDIHFYENAYPTAKFCAAVMESSYVEITQELDYMIQRRVPVFIYNSHNDFQQTNIISNLLPEGVGGFTEAFKSRIVTPFNGSYEDFRHVLHHELTHAITYDLLFGNSFTSLLSRQRLFDLPLWFAEGYAEYSSRHGWDYFSDMFVRDATVNGYLAPPERLGGFLAYKQGQAMIKFIADKYGEDKLGAILRQGKILLTMNKALKSAVGIDQKKLWKEFSKEMKRRYWPTIAELKEADEVGRQLTHAREDGSYYNEKPAFSPDGDKIAIFTDKSDYTEVVLISVADGRRLKRLVKAERSSDLESLHSYVSGVDFSPDGRELVFVAKSKGKEAICFLNVEKGKIHKKKLLDYYNISSPSWSPDGTRIAFAALDGHKRDLFVYHVDTEEITQITDDRFDDVEPGWTVNSSELIFSSDRPHSQNPVLDHKGHPYVTSEGAFMPGDFKYGTYNLFRVELETNRVAAVDVGPGQNRIPKVSPDGRKIAFISNRNGIDNIYIAYLDTVSYYAVTDLLTGVRGLSWSPDGDKIAFSAFFQGAFDIFLLSDLVPEGDNGVLTETDFVRGEYDLLGKSPEQIAVSADSSDLDDTGKLKDASALATTDKSADTTEAETSDSTTTVSETGVYDDEFVFVSETDESALDSVLREIPDDSVFIAAAKAEPASFDSIPPLLPSGEYKISKYKVRFTPDFIGGGFAYDSFFGMRGQTYFVFSDYLGNHQIYVATDLVNSIDQSYIQAYYFNNKHRINLGAGLFHTKNYYIYEPDPGSTRDELFSDRFYGIQTFARRPFSTFSRLEMSLSQYFIDRTYHDRRPIDDDYKRNSKVMTLSGGYVFDNILWGYTGPVNGRRVKLTLDGGKNLFDSDDIEFYSVGLDYRKYWHFNKTFAMAFRLAGGASFGDTPKRYFLGGTTNWIGSRTLDATVYEVENLYFADVVTPLRGFEYYEFSGDRYALINWEFRFPMIQYFAMRYPLPLVLGNIGGAVFTDIGAAWFGDNFRGATSVGGQSRLQDIKTGFGFGMRMNLFGFALLRYDLAWSTDFHDVSDRPTYYFSFGADF